MSYTYHGTTDLVALPNRTVQTFPSGLVRVERSFVCRKADVAKYRATIKVNEPMPFDDGAPAIDGLYIFPEPQEVVRDDGFVEFRVTAYGRGRIDFSAERGAVLGSVRADRAIAVIDTLENTGNFSAVTQTYPSINEALTYRAVFPSGQRVGSIVQAPNAEGASVEIINSSAFDAFINLEFLLETYKLTEFRDQTIFILTRLTSTNFGRWAEWIYTYEARRSVFVTYERKIE